MAKVRKIGNRYVLDYCIDGNRKRERQPVGTRKADAERKLRKILESVDDGTYIATNKSPRFSDVSKKWLTLKRTNIRQSTYSQYRSHVNVHLNPFFGKKQVSAIKLTTVENYIADSIELGTNIATLNKILVNLGAIMNYCVRHNHIKINPVLAVEKPKEEIDHTEKERIKPLGYDEVRLLFNATTEQKYHTLFMFAVVSGMREGELLGLKWDDILWEHGQAEVRRTYNNGRFYPPKTKTSTRKVDLAPQMISQLKRWKVACPPGDLVFPNERGLPMSAPNMYYRYYLPALKKAKIPRRRFHDLRHTYAAMQIDQQVNIKYLQVQMGHSSVKTTLDIYGHLLNTENPEAASKLGVSIFGNDGLGKKENQATFGQQ